MKKDDLTSGGSISPGFILFDPYDNLYYGFKGLRPKLEEFENTIVPALLDSEMVHRLKRDFNIYLEGNLGFQTIERIYNKEESGRNQAKFKKISMLHYLHCLKTSIESEQRIPLSGDI